MKRESLSLLVFSAALHGVEISGALRQSLCGYLMLVIPVLVMILTWLKVPVKEWY